MPGLTGEIRLTQGRLMLLCALLSVLIYGGTLDGGFINYDDSGFIGTNPYLAGSFPSMLSFAFTSAYLDIWHPVTWITYWVDHALWGGSVTGYRAGNLLLHILDSMLVCLLAFRLAAMTGVREQGQRLLAASVVGIGFAIHPLHVEPVAWVASRKDVLYSFFWLLSICCYLDYAEGKGRWRYRASILMFCLAILSKPMAMTLPAVLLLLDYYPLNRLARKNIKMVLIEKLPFFMLTIFSGYMAVFAQSVGNIGMKSLLYMGVTSRLWISVRALSVYAIDAFWPFVRIPAKAPIESVDFLGGEYMGAFIVLLLALATAVYNIRRRPVIFFSIAFYVITVSPVIGLLNFSSHGTADRFMYMPLLGFLALAAAGVVWVSGMLPKMESVLRAILVSVAFAFTLFSANYAQVWTSQERFWAYTTRVNPGEDYHVVAYVGALINDDRNNAAIELIEGVLERNPDNLMAVHSYAKALFNLGRYDEALDFADSGLELFNSSSSYEPSMAGKLMLIKARVFIHREDFHAALVEVNNAIRYWEDPVAYTYRAIVLNRLSDVPAAHRDIRKAIELDPDNLLPYKALLNIARENGDLALAENAINRILELKPEPVLYCERAELYERMGKEGLAAADRVACGR